MPDLPYGSENKNVSERNRGTGSAGCSHQIVVDKKNPFYSGMIFPRIATLRCAGS